MGILIALSLLVGDDAPASAPAPTETQVNVKIGGYAEAYYSFNTASPSNGVNAYRGMDNRAQQFTLSNAVLDVKASFGPVSTRIAFQAGATPDAYYAAEPVTAPVAGLPAFSAEVWKHLQQAYASYTVDVGRGLTLDAGLFLSPVGAESVVTKDNWNFSYGIVANALPFYHIGARASYPLTPQLTASAIVMSGYGGATDNNAEKTLAAALVYEPSSLLTLKVVYVSGVERATGAAEGRAWRHMFDAWMVLRPIDRLELQVHGNGGFEPNAFGTSGWIAGALFARVRILSWLFVAGRGDVFHERAAAGASFMFLPASTLGSLTATVEARVLEHFSAKLELRHDLASAPLFFSGSVQVDPASLAPLPTQTRQTTVTMGVAAWF